MVSNTENIVGPYRITANVSTKEGAAVYHAFDTISKQDVIIRFLIPNSKLSDSLIHRFEHSAAALKKLNHPSLIPVTDNGVHRGVPYIISPNFSGDTLREKLTQPLPWAQAARLLTPAAKALAYLHENHIYHRNIRPENIILDKGFLLADAGVLPLFDLINPPKRKDNENLLSKDIRDMGAVFYEMVTGKQLANFHQQTDKTQLEMSVDVPNPVVQVLKRALSADTDQYKNMADFIHGLETLGWGGPANQSKKSSVQETKPARSSLKRSRLPPRNIVQRKKRKSRSWLIPVTLLVLAAVVAGFILINNFRQDITGIAGLSPSQVIPVTALQEPLQETQIETGPAAATPEDTQAAATPSPIPTETPTPSLGIGSSMISPADGMIMVYVPAGEFFMGSDDREANEQPYHGVYLDAYWIDRTEVTNSMYALCVDEGVCTPPVSNGSNQRKSYYNNLDFAAYPVIFVNWSQANTYCQWSGKRLPTEAEWEKAARGTDALLCPWGNTSPGPDRLNFNNMVGDTSKVGSYPNGSSPYGVMDMSGNVWEWVSDWFSSSYYGQAPSRNPTGPSEGTRHVLRGGSWYYDINYIRSAFRYSADPNTVLNDVGFRCVLPNSP